MSSLLILIFGCSPTTPPSMGGEQLGEETTITTRSAGGVHVLRGAEALAGSPGIEVAVGPVDCGWWVMGPGDLDGDAVPDLVVGCATDSAGVPTGDLRVLSGASLSGGAAAEIATIAVPELLYDRPPLALGDLDGDGLSEIGVETRNQTLGSPRWDWGIVVPGAAAVGAVDAAVVGWRLQAEGGWYPQIVPSPAGDVDGDGVPDVVIAGSASSFPDAEPTPESRVYVVSGAVLAATAPGSALDATVSPLVVLDGSRTLGPPRRVHPAGDVDGDGRADLAVVPSPWEAFDATGPAAPEVRLLAAAQIPAALDDLTEVSAARQEREGDAEVAALGDLDGDGLDELAVRLRAFGSSEDRWDGLAIVPGAAIPPTGALDVTPWLLTEEDVGELEPCDLDGDGLPELVTAAGIWAGTDLLTPGASPVAPPPGTLLACVGDLDGDGTAELAWGDPSLAPLP